VTIHSPRQPDFFGSDDPLIGLRVKLARAVDRSAPCHDNVAEICSGRGPHCYALLCSMCGRFRGWLPKRAVDFFRETIRVAGVPRGPLIYRDATNAKAAAGADGPSDDASAPEGEPNMDISKFLGAAFLKVADLKDGPTKVTITDVTIGKYDKPDLTFDDGTRLSCNVTNTRALARHYGIETDNWIGKQIELSVGPVEFQGKEQEAILARPISPPLEQKPMPKRKKGSGDLDDPVDDF
jgi:hypothetical protein